MDEEMNEMMYEAMSNGQTIGLLEAIRIIHQLAKTDEEFEEAITRIQEAMGSVEFTQTD